MSSTTLSPDAYEQQFLSKAKHFTTFQVWPLHSEMNIHGWLSNFTDDEKEYALAILSNFLYYSEQLMRSMLKSTYLNLCDKVVSLNESTSSSADWAAFVDRTIFLHVTGEEPNNTDSGYHFLRMARQVFELKDARFPDSEDVMLRLKKTKPVSVVFLDDFVGSGNQFCDTWFRMTTLSDGTECSFSSLAANGTHQFFYCPLICTQSGFDRLVDECDGVEIHPTHILSHHYSVVSNDSYLWPSHLKPNAFSVMEKASLRAGLKDTGGADVKDWQGFHKLGLALAFAHSVPDATMPIFYWDRNGWIPLIKRA